MSTSNDYTLTVTYILPSDSQVLTGGKHTGQPPGDGAMVTPPPTPVSFTLDGTVPPPNVGTMRTQLAQAAVFHAIFAANFAGKAGDMPMISP